MRAQASAKIEAGAAQLGKETKRVADVASKQVEDAAQVLYGPQPASPAIGSPAVRVVFAVLCIFHIASFRCRFILSRYGQVENQLVRAFILC